jgi:hypothetical protein
MSDQDLKGLFRQYADNLKFTMTPSTITTTTSQPTILSTQAAERRRKPTPPLITPSWTLHGTAGGRLKIDVNPGGLDLSTVTLRVDNPNESPYVSLDRARLEALVKLIGEILERWTATETMEALGE